LDLLTWVARPSRAAVIHSFAARERMQWIRSFFDEDRGAIVDDQAAWLTCANDCIARSSRERVSTSPIASLHNDARWR
jgi:hypothetical protein